MPDIEAKDGRHFDLRYSGGQADVDGSVPAPVLFKALEGLQRLVHLLAMRREGRELNKRARPSSDIQRRYSLLCLPPREGSYISPMMIGGVKGDLLADADQEEISSELTRVLEAASSGDAELLDRAIPDPTYRRFMFEALEALVPPEQTGLELQVRRNGSELFVASRARPAILRKRRPASAAQIWGVIIGKLIDIDFASSRFGLLHQPTGRRVECSYEPSVEEMLLNHPLDLIQVSGVIERDQQGLPLRVVEADEISDVDDSPYTIDGFSLDNRFYRARRKIEVQPRFEDETQQFVANIDEFGIDAFADTREELESAVAGELRFLWERFALAGDDDLTESAQSLKRALLNAFSEGLDAA